MNQTIADPGECADRLSVGADETPFLLDSHIEITYVLRNLVRGRARATVHFGSGNEALLTALLAVDATRAELVFDCSADEKVNQGVLAAGKLLFHSSQDKVQIRFATAAARSVTLDGKKAFAAPIPTEMLRLQRRDYFRAFAPVTKPVKCIFAIDAEGGYRYIEVRLHDISEGGVAVVVPPGELPAKIGARYANTRIVLPDTGNVVATLEVRHIADMCLLNGKIVQRFGCQFVAPSAAAASLVQRYMMKLERERVSRD